MTAIHRHVTRLKACARCPKMSRPSVAGNPVMSRVILVGQAPGTREPVAGKPFAWTAGKTLFRWFEEFCEIGEEEFRRTVYMAAVCRCFPGKNENGGDRVPDEREISNCSYWLEQEFQILHPRLVIPVGKLAIAQFIPVSKLDKVVGKLHRVTYHGHPCEVIPLPHPSGASPWHRIPPGKGLLEKAMTMIRSNPGWRERI